MKKVLSILFAGVIALLATACYPDDEFAQFDPSKATAPVVSSYEMGAKALTVAYTPGKFNMGFNEKIAPNHMLVITSIDGKSVNKVVSTTNKDNVMTASVSTLSNLFLSMGFQEDQTLSFEALVRATMQNPAQDNGRNGHVDSKEKVSISNFVVTLPKGSPYIEYTQTSNWSVIGSLSAYEISWDKDLEMWTDGAGNHVAAHVQLCAGDEFKFRQDQAWTVNMGGTFGSLDTPFEVTQDGANIVVGADGYYDLFVNPEAGTAWISEAYDPFPDFKEASNWSVIGSLSQYGISWDGDLAMVSDGNWHVALGVTLAAGDEFKFRQDKAWTVNMGGTFSSLDAEFEVTQDGANIVVGADGIFDLFVNPGAGLAKVSETTGAKVSGIIGGDEPGPEPEPVTGWNIIGLNGDWENDILATNDGSLWTAYITVPEASEFKWRLDGAWDSDFGGTFVALDEPFEAVAGGPNIQVAAGFWKVVLDTANNTITISDGNVWSLIGDFNSWAGDVDMVLTDGKWVSPVTHLNANGFKLRHNHDWALSIGGNFEEFGKPFEAVSEDGPNIMLPAEGDYVVTYDPEAQTITIDKSISGWNVIGLNGNWNDDVLATENNGVWTVRVNAPEDTEFKWRKDGGWDENYGGDMVNIGEAFPAFAGGNNIKLPAGYWLLTLDLSGAEPMLMVSDGTVWSLIGVNGDWEKDIDMVLDEGAWVSPETAISGEFKIRKNHDWAENRGGVMASLGEEFDAEPGGANINVPEGTYVVHYYPETEKIVVVNAKKVWSVIGVNGDWAADYEMAEVAPGIWMSDVIEVTSGDWKIRFDHDWAVNRGGTMPENPSVGVFVGAFQDGPNVAMTGTFKVVYNANNETIGTLGWGVVGSIASIPGFSWNNDIPMNLGADGAWYSVPVTLTKDDEIKIRWAGGWDVNRGGDLVAIEEPFEAKDGGNNIKVPADGTYLVTYYPKEERMALTAQFWGLIGEFNGWAGDVFMMYDGNNNWVAYNQTLTGGWKLRQGCGWDVNRGGVFVETGKEFDAVAGGDNINVGDLTNFTVIYNFETEKITVVK